MYQRKRLSPWTRAFVVTEAERLLRVPTPEQLPPGRISTGSLEQALDEQGVSYDVIDGVDARIRQVLIAMTASPR